MPEPIYFFVVGIHDLQTPEAAQIDRSKNSSNSRGLTNEDVQSVCLRLIFALFEILLQIIEVVTPIPAHVLEFCTGETLVL